MYLEYVIGGWELKNDLVNMEAIIKWTTPINVTGAMEFIGIKNYL